MTVDRTLLETSDHRLQAYLLGAERPPTEVAMQCDVRPERAYLRLWWT
ncbi:hypothetical protein [Beutenbergia cavernae]|nr:hypothetical protein [Beutenbergia cavernae]